VFFAAMTESSDNQEGVYAMIAEIDKGKGKGNDSVVALLDDGLLQCRDFVEVGVVTKKWSTRSRSPLRLAVAAGASRIRSHSPEVAILSVPKHKREYQKRMKIFIHTLSGENTTLYMKPRETIKRLKAMIQELKNIPMRQQRLVFNQQALEDHYRLSDYYIQADSTLTLAITDAMQIYIKPRNGARIRLEVYASDTIDNLKAKIEELSGGSGLPPCDQRLSHNGRLLAYTRERASDSPWFFEHSNQTLSEFNIEHQSTVHLDWDNSDDLGA
jgi:hypothetical protein